MAVHVSTAEFADADELATVAALTFPLACPPTSVPENIVSFINTHLTSECFREYVTAPDHVVLAASDGNRIVGYSMLIRGVPDDADVQQAVNVVPSVELSKMYVLPDSHGRGASAALMRASIDRAADMAAKSVWLGVNQQNQRAQRFYAKHGFKINGTKVFHLGNDIENDYVMLRLL
jgi:ribosomal protein S18 acetylase RimI-like enzyme